jgi:hypothetical protein
MAQIEISSIYTEPTERRLVVKIIEHAHMLYRPHERRSSFKMIGVWT